MNNIPLINIFNLKRKLFLFCRDKDGKLSVIEDSSYFPYYFELDVIDGKFKAYTGEKLRKLFVSNPSDIRKQRSVNSWESDIQFTKKYMIDKIDKLEKCPIKIAWLDMEVQSDVFPDPNTASYPISCISVGNSFTRTIKTFWLPSYNSEFEMLEDFIKYMKAEQFDLMVGWNLVKFDYPYLFNRIPDFAEKLGYQGHVRYGGRDIIYPAGISIVDYMVLYKIIFKGLSDYSLDNVLYTEFGEGKKYNKVDFSKLTEDIRLRNIDDIKGMIKIDEKHNIIDHYNEIRMFTKVDWEDFIYNSRAIDMLLLEEAKHKNVVLPMKPIKEEGKKKDKFEGAYREIFEKGRFEKVGKYDLAGAYLNAIIDLNLDSANITTENINTTNTLSVSIKDREAQTVKETYLIRQEANALLPTIAKKLLDEKNKLKKLKNTTNPELPEYKSIEKKYDAMKALVLSAWGVIGNEYFRCFDVRVASMITATVRDVLHYVEDELKKKNYAILYLDTDGIICRDNGENITELLNDLIQQWSQERFGKPSSIKFDYEGRYDVLILLAMCRYKGWIKLESGKIKEETKGIEAKRKDSTQYMKRFQIELLDKIKKNYTKEHIIDWIKNEIKELPNKSLIDISFPCKLARNPEDYSNTPIFLRALQNSTITKRVGESYHYCFIKPEDYEIKTVTKELIMTYDKDGNEKGFKNLTEKRLETACKIKEMPFNKDKTEAIKEYLISEELIKIATLEVQGKAKDVIAFDESNIDKIKDKVDWERMIDRNILMKLVTIFEAMKWDIKEINSNYVGKIEIKHDKETKDEIAEYIEKIKKEENTCGSSVTVAHSTTSRKDKVQVLTSAPNINEKFNEIQKEKAQTNVKEKFDKNNVEIKEITFQEAKEFIKDNHYSHTMPVTNLFLGFSYKNKLNCVIVYGTGACYRLRKSLPNPNVLELTRLFSSDNAPKNMESYCIGQSIKYLKENKPEIKILVSFADPSHGHIGYVYQATNWLYTGLTLQAGNAIYEVDGVRIHPRTLLKKYGTTSKKEALEFLKRDNPNAKIEKVTNSRKHRYIMFIGNKKENREMRKNLKYKILSYPKIKEITND